MEPSRTEAALESLLSLFESELADVIFPDLGVETLRQAEALLTARKHALAEAETALQAAHHAEDEAHRAFVRLGRKAIAYGLVFADDQPKLASQLQGLALELAESGSSSGRLEAAPTANKRRGRPKKADSSLFDPSTEGSTTESPGAEAGSQHRDAAA